MSNPNRPCCTQNSAAVAGIEAARCRGVLRLLNDDADLLVVQQSALLYNAAAEIGGGFLVIVGLLAPPRSFFLVFIYFQFLRMRFWSPDARTYHLSVRSFPCNLQVMRCGSDLLSVLSQLPGKLFRTYSAIEIRHLLHSTAIASGEHII